MRHPRLRRLTWNPLFVAILLAYFIARITVNGVTGTRVAGLVVTGLWFVLSLIDYFTGHKYLDWLYSDEDAEPKH